MQDKPFEFIYVVFRTLNPTDDPEAYLTDLTDLVGQESGRSKLLLPQLPCSVHCHPRLWLLFRLRNLPLLKPLVWSM
jgi:hypothetical protein